MGGSGDGTTTRGRGLRDERSRRNRLPAAVAGAPRRNGLGATNDRRVRAFAAAAGEGLWSARLEVNANANPMSYLSAKRNAARGRDRGRPDHGLRVAIARPIKGKPTGRALRGESTCATITIDR